MKQSLTNNTKSATHAVMRAVNCIGVAAGDADTEFDQQFPDNQLAFQEQFELGAVEPSAIFTFDRGLGKTPRFILNAPVKIHPKAPIKFAVLRQCIDDAVEICIENHVDELEIHEFEEGELTSATHLPASTPWSTIKLEFATSFARVPDITLCFVEHASRNRDLKQVTVFTDGGAEPNPGRGGYGILLRFGTVEKELSQGFQLTTNNRMELLAATVALESLKEKCDVRLYSDSRYVVDAVTTGAVFRWREKRWKKGSVKNIDLWERFLLAYLHHAAELLWVKGHAGITGNERCDQLATQAIASSNLETDQGYVELMAIRKKNASIQKTKQANSKPKKGQGAGNEAAGAEKNPPGAAASPDELAPPNAILGHGGTENGEKNGTGKRWGKPKAVGDPCRNCGTALVRRETKKSSASSAYYFPWHLHCENCNRLYHVKAAKVYRKKT